MDKFPNSEEFGPIFSKTREKKQWLSTLSVTSVCSKNFSSLISKENEVDLEKIWFQQDAATAHTARVSIAFLQTIFPGRVISRHGDVPWPPRSPNSTPSDFFLWGYLKLKVYVDKPRNIQELKESIRREIVEISDDMVKKVMGNFRDRLEQCIAEEGRHLN
ncbi:unnamed protein product [Macrosiphum euphorbiae]|uniref:Uncharacterized protein n=1 Tax=Macrosiphum euphorbiae TaxID=13131 RepID=A0AAV0XQT0_9HEMI|nr:unnamed protein product [Macrosiphum euphorbiae]